MCVCVYVRVCVCVFYVSVGYLAMNENRREAKESYLADLVDLSVYDQVSRGCIRAMACVPLLTRFFPMHW